MGERIPAGVYRGRCSLPQTAILGERFFSTCFFQRSLAGNSVVAGNAARSFVAGFVRIRKLGVRPPQSHAFGCTDFAVQFH